MKIAGLLLVLLQASLLYTIDRFGRADHAQKADLIIVLGAGLQEDGKPTASMVARATHGATLYHRGLAANVLCSGGFTREDYRSEAATCAEILRNAGVPDSAIWLEEFSGSTQENAIHSANWMKKNDWQSAIAVSSSYHLWRTRWLFSASGCDVWTSPAPGGYLSPVKYLRALLRELLAVNWQFVVNSFGLPWTDFPL